MNWAIGQGSCGGRCERSLGKWRIITLTSSVLQSQKPVNNSRSSSGVNKSEEKMVGVAKETVFPGAARRLRRLAFIAVLPNVDLTRDSNPRSKTRHVCRPAPHGRRRNCRELGRQTCWRLSAMERCYAFGSATAL